MMDEASIELVDRDFRGRSQSERLPTSSVGKKPKKDKRNILYPENAASKVEGAGMDDESYYIVPPDPKCTKCTPTAGSRTRTTATSDFNQPMSKEYVSVQQDEDDAEDDEQVKMNLTQMNQRRLRAKLMEQREDFKLHFNYNLKAAFGLLFVTSFAVLCIVLVPKLLLRVTCEGEGQHSCPSLDSPYHKQSGLICCSGGQACCVNTLLGEFSCCEDASSCCGGTCCSAEDKCCGDICIPKEYTCCSSLTYCGAGLQCCQSKSITSCCPKHKSCSQIPNPTQTCSKSIEAK